MSCGVGCRLSSDPKLLWLWRRPLATAPIRPLAWEPPYAMGAALEKYKKTKKKKKKKRKEKEKKIPDANIPDEHRCKNSQQNIRKMNPIIY